jgi:PKD repeat protein
VKAIHRVLVAAMLATCVPRAAEALVVGSAEELPIRYVWMDPTSPYFNDYSCWLSLFVDAAVASNGTDFLVVWSEGHGWLGGSGIWGSRVGANGGLLDPAPIRLSDAQAYQVAVSYSARTDTYLVVWTTYDSDQVSGARVDASGAVLAPGTFSIGSIEGTVPSGLPYHYYYNTGPWPFIAAGGAGFAVFFEDKVVLVGEDGTVSAQAPLGIWSSGAASDGLGYAAIGHASPSTTDGVLVRLDESGLLVGLPTQLGQVDPFAIGFDGANYVVTGIEKQPSTWDWPIVATLIGRDGAVVNPGGTVLFDPLLNEWGTTPYSLAAATDGGREVVAFRYYYGGEYDSLGVFVGHPGGTWADSNPVARIGWSDSVALEIATNQTGNALLVTDNPDYNPFYNVNRPEAILLTTWAALTVSRTGGGTGSVQSSIEGIACGNTCLAQFDAPTTVALTATADQGSIFTGWSGACLGVDPICVVTMDAARSVSAAFERENRPPVASPDAQPASGTAPLIARFRANASDPDGDPISCVWDFGDGGTSTAANPSHVYAQPGTYAATLAVTDGRARASYSLSISVKSAITLSVRMATITYLNGREPMGPVTLWMDLGTPAPRAEESIKVRLDDVQLFTLPFSAFKKGLLPGAFLYAGDGLFVRLDLAKHQMEVAMLKVNLAGIDNSNGVDVEVMVGEARAVQNIKLKSLPLSILKYVRPG